MDPAAISTAIGVSWASGVNLYAAVATLGLMHRFGAIELPGSLDGCGRPWVIGLALVLYCIEFFADKIPLVDSIWDAIHTFIRIPAGAALAAGSMSDSGGGAEIAALLLGGTVAATAHGTKAATRVTLNASPEPFTNIAVSTGEDVAVIGITALVATHPIVAGVIVLAFLGVSLYMLPKILRLLWRGARYPFRLFGFRLWGQTSETEHHN